MSNSKERIVIFGASGHGLVALDAVLRQGRYEMVGWLESFKPAGEIVGGFPILGHPDQLVALTREYDFTKGFLGISDNFVRRTLYEKMRASTPDFDVVSIIHPFSCIASSAEIHKGALVLAGAIVNSGCVVGENCIVNTKASLDHDSEMKPYSSILPGVTTGGGVEIGDCSCVCVGATISHRVRIGEHSIIGAGAVVLKDITSYVLAYGVPARVVRSRTLGERHF